MEVESRQVVNAWEHHKEEIIPLWLDPESTMLTVMEQMKRKYGFCASYDTNISLIQVSNAYMAYYSNYQYQYRLAAWGINKNANANTYAYMDRVIKKRKLDGKETAFKMNGRQLTRRKVQRDITRHVRVSYGSPSQEIPKPDNIQVFTPPSETQTGSTICIFFDNLPWFQFQREI
jgi:hypothetical protein